MQFRSKTIIIICLFFIFCAKLSAQIPQYVISLKDKNNSPYSLSSPFAFLSKRSIDRRIRQNIPIDSTDLPVTPVYVDSIAMSGDVKILYSSRWFNYLIIQTNDQEVVEKIRQYTFVNNAIIKGTRPDRDQRTAKKTDSLTISVRDTDLSIYGKASRQIYMHEGEYLHNNHYLGENMLIAVLDGGFYAVEKNRAFSHLREQDHIIGTYDFVNASKDIRTNASHGADCLSVMASKLPGEMTGTAPNSAYLLLRTEDVASEQPIEESNWEAAVEYADSAGTDVISSSLGYNIFDSPFASHNYSELDGQTTTIAKAASMAVKKGMILVCTAGNEGNKDWHYILSPADADNVLAVGAVDIDGAVADFNSNGPTADGRIKPDVVSFGTATAFVNTSGTIATGIGTSFAVPIIAGLTACLWQAFPDRSNIEILQAIKESSNQYERPDNSSGYGIPNFHTAFQLLLNKQWQDSIKIAEALHENWIKVFPNPFTDMIKLYFHSTDGRLINLQLYNNWGQLIKQINISTGSRYNFAEWPEDFSGLPSGIYYLKANRGKEKSTIKLLKL